MREILFRGKTDKGKWIYGNYAFTDNNGKQHFIFQNKAFEYAVLPETVGQYTGLTDKNGTKIFEGDIVRVDFNGIIKTFVVKFANGCFHPFDIQFNSFDWGAEDTEIIGTIHDKVIIRADKPKITCLNCKYLEITLPYGECSRQLRIVNPDDTCEYAEPKEKGR